MDRCVILRRAGCPTTGEFQEAAGQSRAEGNRRPGDIRWIRSSVFGRASDTPANRL